MIVRLSGRARDGRQAHRAVSLVVRVNQGPHVPAIASVVIARKLVAGQLIVRGAMPCVGMMSLDEFLAEVRDLPLELLTRDG